MKKKIIIGIVIAVILVLLMPIPMRLKDGGSIEFKAILYTVTKYHKIDFDSEKGYIDGIGIKILGKEIYNSTKKDNTQPKKTQTNTGISSEEYFYGKVIESTEKYIIVEPNEGEPIRKSADKISIGLGENNDMIYPIETNVKVTYNGEVMESYPAQIKATKIELKSAEEFELIYIQRKDLEIKTIISKNETDKYTYNIYSYGGDVKINIDDKEYDLREALLNNKITMREIIAKANKDFPNAPSYDDGGSIEYHYEDYTIIKVHKLDGNRDIYIGMPKMTLRDVL